MAKMEKVLSFKIDEFSLDGEVYEEKLKFIKDIKYEDNATGSDLLSFELLDPYFDFLSKDIFSQNISVTFRAYIKGAEDTPIEFEGFVSAVDPDFGSDGIPRLVIHCMDNTYRMNRKKKSRTWEKMKVSQVVADIVSEYDFLSEVHIDDTLILEDKITQGDKTDIEFLQELAKKQVHGYQCYIVGKKFYFKRKELVTDPSATLFYREPPYDIISFGPRINKETKKEEVKKADINSEVGTKTELTLDDKNPENAIERELQGKAVKTSESYHYIDGEWVEEGDDDA